MRKYDKDDNRAGIVKLAIRRAIERPRNRIDSIIDAAIYIKASGIKSFIGNKLNWSSTEEGGDFWMRVYSSLPGKKETT